MQTVSLTSCIESNLPELNQAGDSLTRAPQCFRYHAWTYHHCSFCWAGSVGTAHPHQQHYPKHFSESVVASEAVEDTEIAVTKTAREAEAVIVHQVASVAVPGNGMA